MNNRFDLYGPVHKGIRSALGGLCQQTGAIDISDAEKLKSFVEEFRRVAIMLEAHSRDEDAYINESLEKFAPDTLIVLEREHRELDQALEELMERMDQLQINEQNPREQQKIWFEIGRRINRFSAEYFMHLQTEEGPGMMALWENLRDDELKVISINIRSSIPPETMVIFMHYMIPAMNHHERLEIFKDMKQVAPPEAYENMLQLAESRLDSHNMARLNRALEELKMN